MGGRYLTMMLPSSTLRRLSFSHKQEPNEQFLKKRVDREPLLWSKTAEGIMPKDQAESRDRG